MIGLLWAGMSSFLAAPSVGQTVVFMIALVAIPSVLGVTVVQLVVYGLSYIGLTSDGVVIKNWITLFVGRNESFEWQRLSRSVASKGGVFGQVLNYGTIGIETNGGSVQASITLIPKPEYWQDIFQKKADESSPDPV